MPTHTFPLTGPIDLDVRVDRGSITITARDDLDTASVRLEADGADTAGDSGDDAAQLLRETEVGLRGSTLVVAAPREGVLRRGHRPGLHVHVEVPTSTPVRATSASAALAIDGRVGDTRVDAASGSTEIDEVGGNLRLRCASGSVRAARVDGSAQVRAGSGDVDLGPVGGDLDADSGSGDLQVAAVQGRVHARCGSGETRLGEVHGDVDAVGGSGAVEIGVPADVSAHLDVRTGSGRLRSELPVDDEPVTGRATITVRARTGSGDVRLFRAAQAPVV